MRRTNHWLVCDRDERHQFGPARSIVELLARAQVDGWKLGLDGHDLCSVCDREPTEAMGKSA